MAYNGGYGVFPEALKPLDDNLRRAVRQLEEYTRYMCERADFAIGAIRQLPKVSASDAGKVLAVNDKGEWVAIDPSEI